MIEEIVMPISDAGGDRKHGIIYPYASSRARHRVQKLHEKKSTFKFCSPMVARPHACGQKNS